MEEENEMHVQNDKHVDTAGVLESSPNLKKCACAIEPDPDSIGARLRQRRRKSNGQDDAEFMGVNDKTSVVTAAVKTMSSNQNKRIKMKCMSRMVNVLMALLSWRAVQSSRSMLMMLN